MGDDRLVEAATVSNGMIYYQRCRTFWFCQHSHNYWHYPMAQVSVNKTNRNNNNNNACEFM
jgi:hypothetical protein